MNVPIEPASAATNPETVPGETTVLPSRLRLFLEGYLSLLVAVVLGMVISAPFIYSRARCFSEMTFLLGASPSDDTLLTQWALSRTGVVSFKTERREGALWVRSEYRSFQPQPPPALMAMRLRELGYEFRGMRGGVVGLASNLRDTLTDAPTLAMILAGMQVAFGFIGLNRIRAARNKGRPMPPLFAGHHGRAIAIGVSGGVVLLAIGLVNQLAVKALLGHLPPSPWDSSAAMSATTKLVFLVFGAFGAPLTEELFFRGYLFGQFKGAGHVRLGIIVSAALFGAIHFSDAYNVPAICLFGVVLAWLFHRTGSLLAPIVAHAVNNAVSIAIMVL